MGAGTCGILFAMKQKTKILNYRVILEQDEDGLFVASVPTIQGCYTQGKTFEEAMKNIQEAIELCLEVRNNDLEQKDDSKTQFVGIKNISFSYPYGTFART